MSYATDYSFFFHPTLRNGECTKIDDIAPYINGVNWDGLTPDNADIILKELNEKEEGVFNEFRNAGKRLAAAIAESKSVNLYKKYIRIKKRIEEESTHNEFVDDQQEATSPIIESKHRSNQVFTFSYWIRHFDYSEKEPYTVSWFFAVYDPVNENSYRMRVTTLKSQHDKDFKSLEDAKKYIAGRIKAYDKYFQEEIPEIPKKCEGNFRVADKLLPGFRVSKTLSFD